MHAPNEANEWAHPNPVPPPQAQSLALKGGMI